MIKDPIIYLFFLIENKKFFLKKFYKNLEKTDWCRKI